jgi:DNA-directed RNA polymerase omega subunit
MSYVQTVPGEPDNVVQTKEDSMAQYVSRGEAIDKEKCIRLAGGNQFDLIMMAAQRAREIKQQNRHSQKLEHTHGVVTALSEIQSGKIDWEYWKKVK